MPRASLRRLADILDAVAAIARYTRAGKPAFDADGMLRDAVVARLIQIGQAVKDAQADGLDLRRLAPEIPWRNIAGMRDKLAHRYWELDAAIVWSVVEVELPKLEAAVRPLLKQAPPPKPARAKRRKV